MIGGEDRLTNEITRLSGTLPPAVQALTGIDLTKVEILDDVIMALLNLFLQILGDKESCRSIEDEAVCMWPTQVEATEYANLLLL